MCNKPLYRLPITSAMEKNLSRSYYKRIRNGGIIMDRYEMEYFCNCLGFTFHDFQSIPCGSCYGCKADYQNMWTTRAVLESTLHDENYFITLTYNDEHINYKPIMHPVTGEIKEVNVIVENDFSAFIKRLRAYNDYHGIGEFSTLSCSEYGDNTKRPHFHFLAFGLHIDDLIYYYSKTKSGKITFNWSLDSTPYYLSKSISDAWGKGFILITPLTLENCSYVCSYVNKKVTPSQIKLNSKSVEVLEKFNKQFDSYENTIDNCISLGLIPSPRLNMSRKKGIASDWFADWKNKYSYFYYGVLPKMNGKRLPKQSIRYFDNKVVDTDEEFLLIFAKERRKKVMKKDFLQWSDYGQTQRDIKEEILKKRHDKRKPRDL